MSWRSGSALFIDIWPLVQRHIPDRDQRIEFTAKLLQLFVENDMASWDLEDVHPDIRAAMRDAGIEISEPDRYVDDEAADPGSPAGKSNGDKPKARPSGLALAVIGFILGAITVVLVVLALR